MSTMTVPIMMSMDEIVGGSSEAQRWGAVRKTIDGRSPSGNRPPQVALEFWLDTGEHNVVDHYIDDDARLRRSLMWLEVRSRKGVFVLELVVLDYDYVGWLRLTDSIEMLFAEENIPVEVDIVEGKIVNKHTFEKVKRPFILVEGLHRQYGDGVLCARMGISNERMDEIRNSMDEEDKLERLRKRKEKIEEGKRKVAEWAAQWPRHDEMATGHRASSAGGFF